MLTVPFVWDEHEQHYDFSRNTSFAPQSLSQGHGFRIIEQRKSVTEIGVVFQPLNDYLYKKKATRYRYLILLAVLALMAPINILGVLQSKVLPDNDGFYLDSIVLARKVASA